MDASRRKTTPVVLLATVSLPSGEREAFEAWGKGGGGSAAVRGAALNTGNTTESNQRKGRRMRRTSWGWVGSMIWLSGSLPPLRGREKGIIATWRHFLSIGSSPRW